MGEMVKGEFVLLCVLEVLFIFLLYPLYKNGQKFLEIQYYSLSIIMEYHCQKYEQNQFNGKHTFITLGHIVK